MAFVGSEEDLMTPEQRAEVYRKLKNVAEDQRDQAMAALKAAESKLDAAQSRYAEMEQALMLLTKQNADLKRRYTWAANELLACDYGDNDNPAGVVGWRVYGWRDRIGNRRIYGQSIDAAIDAETP